MQDVTFNEGFWCETSIHHNPNIAIHVLQTYFNINIGE